MERERLQEILRPYLAERELPDAAAGLISTYIDILLRWNARTNLTAVRDPEQIVGRHFGESLFAAVNLVVPESDLTVNDLGSGAGFPGIPIKIFAPGLRMTLIESQIKKVTFLREVIRALELRDVAVHYGRAEQFGRKADLLTFRAVEKFDSVLPVALGLVAPGGRLAMLVGAAQVARAKELVGGDWQAPIPVPGSESRVLAVRNC